MHVGRLDVSEGCSGLLFGNGKPFLALMLYLMWVSVFAEKSMPNFALPSRQ